MTSDAAGIASLSILLPPPGFMLGTQAVALNPCATPPFPIVLTQAYTFQTI